MKHVFKLFGVFAIVLCSVGIENVYPFSFSETFLGEKYSGGYHPYGNTSEYVVLQENYIATFHFDLTRLKNTGFVMDADENYTVGGPLGNWLRIPLFISGSSSSSN